MERAVTDTQPLPVMESAAPPTVALPVEPPAPPPTAVVPQDARNRTALVLGLLAVAAVVAIGLSALALARRNDPSAPADRTKTPTSVPGTAEAAPGAAAPTTVPAAPPSTASTVAPVRVTPSTSAPTSDGGGKGRGGGKGKG